MNKEVEELLTKCDNCKLKECIGCEFTYTDIQKIRKYVGSIELLNETYQVINELSEREIKELEQKESILDKVVDKLEKIHEKYTKEYERVEGLELYTASIYVQQELGCVLDDIESILMMKGIDSK